MDFIEEFKIPFYKIKIDDWQTKKKKLLEIYKLNESHLTNDQLYSKVYTDYFKNHNYSEKLYKILYTDINKFAKKTNKSLGIGDSWFQKYDKGCFHSPHTHGTLGYSSVCFVEYDEKEHQPPRFICPFNDVEGNVIIYDPEDISEGTMIFFPSMLLHYVLPNLSNKQRIIISMNFTIFK